jgi:antitoxin component of MazEF toxin-antitoxin module
MNSDFDYKNYSLEKLEEWIHDAISCAEASPQEVYDTIKKVVEENYHIYKNNAARCYELLCLLNGNGKGHIPAYDEYLNEKKYYEPSMPPWGHSDLEYWGSTVSSVKKDKVKKWVLPVEADGPSGEYFITFPDDLLEAANLKEGDQVEWIDQGEGSYLLKKIEKQMTYDEAIAAGWTMTADGFWIKESN